MPVLKTNGTVLVTAFAASADGPSPGENHGDSSVDQVRRQRRQSIVLALCPAIFGGDVLAFDKAGFG
jgi:hypothetical protein